MKKMIKTLTLVTVLAMMVCSMSVAVLAAAEDENDGEGIMAVNDEVANEENAEQEAPATAETDVVNDDGSLYNPSTGITAAPAAMMALAGISLAGAVAAVKKK